MGLGRPVQGKRSLAPDGESAVTPVIGAVLILAITIMGIAGVLLWGAPMIERVQAQNAQAAMVGEFEDLRDSSRDLSVPDHSRFPTIVLPRGEVELEPGSRIMVTIDRDTGTGGFPNCDFHVTNWADTTARTDVSVSAVGCRIPVVTGSAVTAAQALLQVYSVTGATIVLKTTTSCNPCTTATVAGVDFSAGDWLFRLSNSLCPGGICAEAWLHSGDQVRWTLESGAGLRSVTYDHGAIFSLSDGTTFLEREPIIGDAAFGTNYFGLWLRSLTASSYNGFSGTGSHQVYLSLLGNYDRSDSPGVSRLRFDFNGAQPEAWCNSLVARNDALPDGADVNPDPDSSYRSDTAATTPCSATSGDTSGTRSACYAMVASTANACATSGFTCPTSTSGHCFTFRFLHARIYTSLSL